MSDASTIAERKAKMAANAALMDKRWQKLEQDRADMLAKKINGDSVASRTEVGSD